MAVTIGLILSLVALIFVGLPILTFLRLSRISRDFETLSERVRALEKATALRSEARAERPAPAAETAHGVHAPFSGPPADIEPQSTVVPLPPMPPGEAEGQADAERRSVPIAVTAIEPGEAPDLESRIGGRGLLYTGVVVLLFGVSFFLKYAFDNAWINETGRVVLGAIGGVALIAGGLRLARHDLEAFGQALVGLGLAILYLAIYAALNFYSLIGPTTAFGLMGMVTMAAGGLADRQASQALAFIAVCGGFVTPFLVGSEENAQTVLFTYDALLIGGTLVLARRHQWIALNAASYLLTFATVTLWAMEHYTAGQWLRTLLFLTLFLVLFLIILRETARTTGIAARLVTGLLAQAPLFYHVVAVILTAAHPPAIHVYLIAFTAAGLWLTAEPHRPWLRLLILIGGFSPLLGSLTLPDGLSWTVPNVVTIVAVAALHMMAILDRIVRQESELRLPDLVALHVTGLGLFALLYKALQPAYPDFRGALAALTAAGAAALWWWLRARERVAALHAAALAFALVAIGIAVQYDGPAVVVGWAAEGAAVAWVGLRAPSVPFQSGGLVLWALAALQLFDGSYFLTPANFTAIINARAATTGFVIVLGYALAWIFNRSTAPEAKRIRAAMHVGCSLMTVSWITAEIRSFWEVRGDTSQAHLYEQVMLSLAWGLYGATLIALGMQRAYAPTRYIGIAIIAVTIVKVFFYDLWELGGVYRIIGFLGFGILLVLVSYLYQKRRTSPTGASPPPAPPE